MASSAVEIAVSVFRLPVARAPNVVSLTAMVACTGRLGGLAPGDVRRGKVLKPGHRRRLKIAIAPF